MERTLRRIRRLALQETTVEQQGGAHCIELAQIEQIAEEAHRRLLRDFALLKGNGLQTNIARPR
mgnify:CR=1 FL=1